MNDQTSTIQQLRELVNKFRKERDWNKANSLNRRELLLYSRYYRTFIEILKTWEKEILTLIETRITNGYTEGIHTKIKLLKRMSYGISNPTTYIKRMILALSDDYFADSFHTI